MINLVYLKIAIVLALICILSLPVEAQDTSVPDKNKEETVKPTTNENDSQVESTKEVITGTSDRMERDQKNGLTILIGNAKTVRKNEEDVEIGFLNADKITLKSDPESGETIEIIAEGNVEIRDQDMFATCDHATMNNLTNIIVLKDNVVVTQNKDKLETKLFTYNRTTGKQTGVGDVKFKVSITQANPTQEQNSEEQNDTSEDEPTSNDSQSEKSDEKPETSTDTSDESEEQDTSTEDNSNSDSSDNSNEESDEKENTDEESNNEENLED